MTIAKKSASQYGFTLIELMIVIAIIAILVSIAIPAYQDYSVRAQNSECLSVTAPAKAFVAETAYSQGVTVDSGVADFSGYQSPVATELCSAITMNATTGVITVTSAGSGGQFILTPSQNSAVNSVEWVCTAPGIPANQAPATCRGAGSP